MSLFSYTLYASTFTITTSTMACNIERILRFKMSVISYTLYASTITLTSSTTACSIDRIPLIQDVSYLLHMSSIINYINYFHYVTQHWQDPLVSRWQLSLTHNMQYAKTITLTTLTTLDSRCHFSLTLDMHQQLQ